MRPGPNRQAQRDKEKLAVADNFGWHFNGSNFSAVFLQLCSLLNSDRLKLDGQRDCGSHLHGLGRNPPQASSVEARMPQLLSGPALALSLVKVQFIGCPVDYF